MKDEVAAGVYLIRTIRSRGERTIGILKDLLIETIQIEILLVPKEVMLGLQFV